MLKRFLFLICLSVLLFAMNSAEININDKDLEVSAKIDLFNIDYNVNANTMFVGAKFLYADKTHSDRNDINPFYEINFLMMGEVNYGMKLGLGIKLNHTKDFTSIPLGIEFSYEIPQIDFPTYLSGYVYYATSVLSYEDADNFLEYRLSCDFEIIQNGLITLGYRKLDTNYEKRGDLTYNSSWFAGFKIRF
jgi:hypothetical protein